MSDLPAGSRMLMRARVLAGLRPDDPPVSGAKNDPMTPLVWVREYQLEGGRPGQAVVSTMGSAADFRNAGLRRLFVNAVFWGCGLEVPDGDGVNVDPVASYNPPASGFNGFRRNLKPADLKYEQE